MKDVLRDSGRYVRPRRIEVVVNDDKPMIEGARLRNLNIVQGAGCSMTPVDRKQSYGPAGCQEIVRAQVHRVPFEDLDAVQSRGEFFEISRQLRIISQSRLVDIEFLIVEQIDREGDFALRFDQIEQNQKLSVMDSDFANRTADPLGRLVLAQRRNDFCRARVQPAFDLAEPIAEIALQLALPHLLDRNCSLGHTDRLRHQRACPHGSYARNMKLAQRTSPFGPAARKKAAPGPRRATLTMAPRSSQNARYPKPARKSTTRW